MPAGRSQELHGKLDRALLVQSSRVVQSFPATGELEDGEDKASLGPWSWLHKSNLEEKVMQEMGDILAVEKCEFSAYALMQSVPQNWE